MIQTSEDLRFYLKEDYRRNFGVDRLCFLAQLKQRILKTDSWIAYDYLKSLRKYEYALNRMNLSNGLISRLFYNYEMSLTNNESIKYISEMKSKNYLDETEKRF